MIFKCLVRWRDLGCSLQFKLFFQNKRKQKKPHFFSQKNYLCGEKMIMCIVHSKACLDMLHYILDILYYICLHTPDVF